MSIFTESVRSSTRALHGAAIRCSAGCIHYLGATNHSTIAARAWDPCSSCTSTWISSNARPLAIKVERNSASFSGLTVMFERSPRVPAFGTSPPDAGRRAAPRIQVTEFVDPGRRRTQQVIETKVPLTLKRSSSVNRSTNKPILLITAFGAKEYRALARVAPSAKQSLCPN